MTFRPPPVQRPRIPVWVVGAWPSPRSMARAAQWDGIVAQAPGGDGTSAAPAPDQLREIVADLARQRAAAGRSGPYDVIAQGSTPAADPGAARAAVAPYADAGATWWIEADWEMSLEGLRGRVAAGPPRPSARHAGPSAAPVTGSVRGGGPPRT
jgi:alkanesulfonate monooxygenase SsuD/methylene tetrahydromethanopterin reductase-like flavin-dependent oxidoreductase (luciferase family)